MAVLAEYNPETSSYAKSANAFIGGEEAGQSMMARAQAMRIQQQQADQQQAEFVAKLPAIQATAQANTVSAHSAVVNATRMQNLRAQAATEAPGFNDQFIEAMQLADWDARSDALAQLQPKVAYMSLFPEYKGFVDTVNNQRVQAHQSAMVDAKLEEQQQIADDNRAAREEQAQIAADSRRDVAAAMAGGRTAAATIYSGTRERIADATAQNRLDVQGLKGSQAAAKPADTISRLAQLADESDQNAAEATARGDEATAGTFRATSQAYRDGITKASTFAGGAPSAVPSKSPPLRPTVATNEALSAEQQAASSVAPGAPAAQTPAAPAVAPTKVPKDAVSVDIGGKTYPIFKDKNGNRAYKVDGHFVPIDTE